MPVASQPHGVDLKPIKRGQNCVPKEQNEEKIKQYIATMSLQIQHVNTSDRLTSMLRTNCDIFFNLKNFPSNAAMNNVQAQDEPVLFLFMVICWWAALCLALAVPHAAWS